jgi:hypothetical protein
MALRRASHWMVILPLIQLSLSLKKDGVLRPETKVWTSKYLNNLTRAGSSSGEEKARATMR